MQRDSVLVAEIINAAERIIELTAGRPTSDLESDPDSRDALLWNFTVLGDAVGQLSDETKAADPGEEPFLFHTGMRQLFPLSPRRSAASSRWTTSVGSRSHT